MEGYNFDMETTLTINPDLTGLESAYLMSYHKLSQWRLKGMHKYENEESSEDYYCLAHHDNNIYSVTRGERSFLRKKVMKLLCNDVYCNKSDGKLDNLSNISIRFQNYIVEFTPEEYLYLDQNDIY